MLWRDLRGQDGRLGRRGAIPHFELVEAQDSFDQAGCPDVAEAMLPSGRSQMYWTPIARMLA
jgi:hypothetical protein